MLAARCGHRGVWPGEGVDREGKQPRSVGDVFGRRINHCVRTQSSLCSIVDSTRTSGASKASSSDAKHGQNVVVQVQRAVDLLNRQRDTAQSQTPAFLKQFAARLEQHADDRGGDRLDPAEVDHQLRRTELARPAEPTRDPGSRRASGPLRSDSTKRTTTAPGRRTNCDVSSLFHGHDAPWSSAGVAS